MGLLLFASQPSGGVGIAGAAHIVRDGRPAVCGWRDGRAAVGAWRDGRAVVGAWRDGPEASAFGALKGARASSLAEQANADSSRCPGNLLANPGFEGGFTVRHRMNEVVAVGWHAWYRSSPSGREVPSFGPLLRPRDGAAAAWRGLWAQEVASADAIHVAGLYQRLRLPSGSQLVAQVRAYAWTSDGDDPNRSLAPNDYALLIGIDPLAREDPTAPHIVWSTPVTQTDAWLPLSVEAGVHGSMATVFLRGQGLRPHRHVVSRWDEACARVLHPIGESALPATAEPIVEGEADAGTLAGPAPPEAMAVVTRQALAAALRATVTSRDGQPPAPGLAAEANRQAGLVAPTAEEGWAADQSAAVGPGWRRMAAGAGLVFLAAAAFSLGLFVNLAGSDSHRPASGPSGETGGERDPG